MSIETVLKRAVGEKGKLDRIVFREGSHVFDCLVPDDNLWGSVKDNLILSEYERCGVRLSDFTGTVVDAGAHVGLFSLRAAVHASNVLAIEPHPVTSTLLRLNLERNKVENVVTLQKALWPVEASLALVDGAHSGANAVTEAKAGTERVEVVTLDDVIEWYGTIDLLKIDIEGAEFDVISHAAASTLAKIRVIVGELHLRERRHQQNDVVRKLASAGFSVTLLAPPVDLWRESVSRLVGNWAKLEGNTRLKAVVLAAYTFAAIERKLMKGANAERDFGFLYALRGSYKRPHRQGLTAAP